MQTIKLLFLKRFKALSIITTASLFSLILLMVRIKLTHSFHLLFLVWNLFLAVIPYAITIYLTNNSKLNKWLLMLWFVVWLLFLPNAPYIVTDLIHLRVSYDIIWLDIIVIMSFAITGLLLFFLSVEDMMQILKKYSSIKTIKYTAVVVCFLSGFGVYLGRFLRYNSWEILSKPQMLFEDIFSLVTHPFLFSEAWLFTFLFGVFLNLGFWMFKST